MSHPIHQIADINPSFYLDASPAGDYPFDEVNTCPVFIAPNYATLKWKNISKHHLNSKIDDLNRIHDKAFFNEYMIYIHVPFCRSFCHYCNFARDKFPWKDRQTLATYTDYLLREFDAYQKKFAYLEDKTLTALYIGDGSPSTLGVQNIDKLLGHLGRRLSNYRQFSVNAVTGIEIVRIC